MQKKRLRRMRGAVMLAAGAASAMVHAGGFGLIEHSARGLGVSYSDGVAGADDPGVLFLNPAGLARIAGTQVTGSVTGLKVDARFEDRGSTAAFGQGLGSTSENGGTSAAIPAIFAALRMLPNVTLGVGVFAPFGLATKYDAGWAGRFVALDSEIQSLALNASVAWKATPALAFGAGIERRRFEATLTNAVNYTGVIAAASAVVTGAPIVVPGLEGRVELKGRDDGWGFTAGADWLATERLRLGVGYRSATQFVLAGRATFDPPALSDATLRALAAGALPSGPASLRLRTPDTWAFGAAWTSTPASRLYVEAARTGWSSLQEQRVLRDDGGLIQLLPLRWRDSWRYSIGADYRVSGQLLLRAGITRDATPIPDDTRSARLPSNTFVSVGTGLRWTLSPSRSIDLAAGATHVRKTPVRQDDGSAQANGLLLGEYSNRSFLLAAQFTQSF